MNAPEPIHINQGDTGTAITAILKQDGSPVDLTGKAVEFAMETDADSPAAVVSWSATNVTVVNPTAGKVKYNLQSAAVDVTGRFRYAFRLVENGSQTTTFPKNWAIVTIEDTITT